MAPRFISLAVALTLIFCSTAAATEKTRVYDNPYGDGNQTLVYQIPKDHSNVFKNAHYTNSGNVGGAPYDATVDSPTLIITYHEMFAVLACIVAIDVYRRYRRKKKRDLQELEEQQKYSEQQQRYGDNYPRRYR